MRWPGRKRAERELEAELAFHLEQASAKLGSARAAEALFGGSEAVKEECRTERRGAVLGDFARDLQVGRRMLRRNPGFAVTAIVTLALAIGANTAAFSVADSVLRLQAVFPGVARIAIPIGVDRSGQLMAGNPFRSGDFADYRANAHAFAELAGWSYKNANLAARAGAAHVELMQVTRGFFAVWGVGAARGRTLQPGDADREREIVLSDKLWSGPLGGANILGQTVQLDGAAYTVIGIMPPGFGRNVFDPDAWTSLTLTPAQLAAHRRATAATLELAGRLRPGATLAEAQAELQALSAAEGTKYPGEALGEGTTAITVDRLIKQDPAPLAMLLGVTGLILLIGCGSVAGLMLERNAARAPEMATRQALGASRLRLVRQLLTESLLIATLAGVTAVGLAWATMRWLDTTMLANTTTPAQLNWRVLFFAAAVALATAMLTGLAPALSGCRPAQRLSFDRQHMRSVLVAGQIALAVVALAASTTLVMAIWQERHSAIGYEPAGVLGGEVELAGPAYETAAQRAVLAQRLDAAAAALPGAEEAAIVSPPAMEWDQPAFEVRGAQPKLDTPVKVWAVTPGYFGLLKIPALAGRGFTGADGAGAEPVAIVSATAAQRLFPRAASAIGEYLRLDRSGEPAGWRRVIGVVGDVKVWGGEKAGDCVNVYEPLLQSGGRSVGVLVRSPGAADREAGPLREALRRLDPALPLFGVRPIAGMGAQDTGGDQYFAELLSGLVAIVLLAAGIGLYGIVAFAAARRRREVAIRMALGASRVGATRLLLGSGLRLAAVGLGVGFLLAWMDSYVLANMFEGVATRSVPVLGTAAGLLLAVIAVATLVPVRRAIRVAPFSVLKEQ